MLLEKATGWDRGRPAPFVNELAALRDTLLLRLLPDDRPRTTPIVDSQVRALLGDVLVELGRLVLSSNSGPAAVLDDYVHDLENDPIGVQATLDRYRAIYAATCGQSASKEMAEAKGDLVYDTVIIDEAAHANPLDLFIPMSQAKRRVILVGDHRQLPQSFEVKILDELEQRDDSVDEQTLEMLKKSLFERLFQRLPNFADKVVRTITLDTQFRMHPVLGDFVSAQFYEPHGETVKSGRPAEDFVHGLPDYCHPTTGAEVSAAWLDVPARRGYESPGRSKSRTPEAQSIAEEVAKIIRRKTALTIGVISFYSAQTVEICEALVEQDVMEKAGKKYQVVSEYDVIQTTEGKYEKQIQIDTVDAFQGKEFDVVFLSMTRSNNFPEKTEGDLRKKFGHLMLPNRMCVSMSRQRRLLVVAGDSRMLQTESAARVIAPLVEFYKLCGGEHGVRFS